MMGAAFASFQDTGTSTGNTFTAGTLDLKLTDDNEGLADGVTSSWTMSNMTPGLSSVTNGVTLKNTGSVAANHVKISFVNTIQDTPDLASDTNWSSVPADMAKWLQIILMSYDGVTFLGLGSTPGHQLIDTNSNGFIDLDDVTNPANEAALSNLLAPLPNSVGSETLSMHIMFNAGATNDIQGDTLTTTVTFTLQ
jgi:hypothetical protein